MKTNRSNIVLWHLQFREIDVFLLLFQCFKPRSRVVIVDQSVVFRETIGFFFVYFALKNKLDLDESKTRTLSSNDESSSISISGWPHQNSENFLPKSEKY